MSEAERLFGQEHVRRYRETDGAVGHIWKRGSKTLLLTTAGRRTGKPTTTPLIYEQLLLLLYDDGIGGADPSRGSGLVGLRDRVEAVGGSLEITSKPGVGTSLVAALPLRL